MGNSNEAEQTRSDTPVYSQGATQMNAPAYGAPRPNDAPPPGTP